MQKTKSGFTIVELLIVIVVIGILAAITIVAFNGIQERARVSAVSSALTQGGKKVALWQVDNTSTAPDCSTMISLLNAVPGSGNGGTICNSSAGDVAYQYRATGGEYCLTATKGVTSYKLDTTSSTKNPTSGACSGHGAGGVIPVTNLVLNPNAEGSSSWAVGGTVNGGYVAGFDGATRAYRMTRTGAGSAVLRAMISTMNPSSEYSVIVTLRSNIDTPTTIQTRGTSSSNDASSYTAVNLVANQPQTVKISGTSWSGTHTSPSLAVTWGTGAANDWLEATRAFVVAGQYSGNYADGGTANWTWNGAVNNSSSTGPPV